MRTCPEIASCIQKIKLQQNEDVAVWKPNSAGTFSITSCYEVVRNKAAKVEWHNLVWMKPVFPRHGFCMWLSIRNRLKTKVALIQRGMNLDDQCVFCSQPETCEHLFFDCPFTRVIWREVLRRLGIARMPRSWSAEKRWLLRRGKGRSRIAKRVRVASTAAIYEIWRERNRRIFANQQRTQSYIIAYVNSFLTAMS